jgi:CheY-like chemotaxis protein
VGILKRQAHRDIKKVGCRMARILIADDSEASRSALRSLIQGNRWEVCGEAGDVLSAVEKAAILKPDLVIWITESQIWMVCRRGKLSTPLIHAPAVFSK